MSPCPNPALTGLLAATLLASCTTPPSLSSSTTPTGISYVDEVIEAVESADPYTLTRLFVLRTVPCTTQKGLLSQPLCPPGKTDGALLQTMPLLGAGDLGHLTIDQINAWPGIGQAQLYAVYRTGSYTYSDEFFPAGEYAVAFLPKGSESGLAFIFQVTKDGIVRIDYCGIQLDVCLGSTIEEVFQEHGSEFVLGPLPVSESTPEGSP